MSRYELVDVNDLALHLLTVFLLIQQLCVCLLRLGVARQQEHLVAVCEAFEVALVPEEDVEHLVGQLGIQTHARERLHLLLACCLNAVLIVEVIELSVFELRHIPQSVEGLDVAKVLQQISVRHAFLTFY